MPLNRFCVDPGSDDCPNCPHCGSGMKLSMVLMIPIDGGIPQKSWFCDDCLLTVSKVFDGTGPDRPE